ncbi:MULTISPECIES: hypothetical protein [unclassified Roseovarius]|nr:hypothetical protein [Roseovarius sp. MMSF_3350]
MFGLIRLVVLSSMTFVAGVFYERHNVSETCKAQGGLFSKGLCTIAEARQ